MTSWKNKAILTRETWNGPVGKLVIGGLAGGGEMWNSPRLCLRKWNSLAGKRATGGLAGEMWNSLNQPPKPPSPARALRSGRARGMRNSSVKMLKDPVKASGRAKGLWNSRRRKKLFCLAGEMKTGPAGKLADGPRNNRKRKLATGPRDPAGGNPRALAYAALLA